jgi:hypothetical protein
MSTYIVRQTRGFRLEISFVQIKLHEDNLKIRLRCMQSYVRQQVSRAYRSIDPSESQDFDSSRYTIEYSCASVAPRREVALLLARARATSARGRARDKSPAVRRRFINVMSRFCSRLNSHAPLYPPQPTPPHRAAPRSEIARRLRVASWRN